jgi:hypothetical protein
VRAETASSWRRTAVVALLAIATATAAVAAPSAPQRLRTVFATTGIVKAPQLIADSAGRLHLFFLAGDVHDRGRATDRLMYAAWQNEGWSEPVVVQKKRKGVRLDLVSVALAADGWIHAVWQRPPFGRLSYSRVYAARAGERAAWTRRRTLTEVPAFRSDLDADGRGRVHFVYAQGGGDVYYLQSTDGGRSWSEDVAVSRVTADREATDYPRVAVDARGVVHVVWSQYLLPRGVPAEGVYYSRSEDGGRTWAAPRRMDGKHHAQINVATRGDSEVHVVWHGTVAVGDRKHAWSADGGETWSEAVDLPGIRGGLTGPSPLVVDGGGGLHVVSAVDGDRKVERVATLAWRDGLWSQPSWLSDGCGAVDSVEQPAAAVLLGNQLHTVFEVDYRAIVHQVTDLAAPDVAPRPLPTMRVPTWIDRAGDASAQLYVFAATVLLVAATAVAQLAGNRGVRRRGR